MIRSEILVMSKKDRPDEDGGDVRGGIVTKTEPKTKAAQSV